jgi:NAD(P)-dependent dehydrogenase (short-subunit alcohol dehydrogenase family)
MLVVMIALENKVVLVTGGGRGIGAAIALRLAGDGADVALTYEHDTARATEVVAGIKEAGRRGLAIRADSADSDAVTAAVAEVVATFGRLDVLVNNAGVFHVGPLDDLGPAEIDRTLAVNVKAPFVASRAAVRHMTDGGRIISIGSNAAERVAFPGFALYSLSKTALIGMTRGLARDLGPAPTGPVGTAAVGRLR